MYTSCGIACRRGELAGSCRGFFCFVLFWFGFFFFSFSFCVPQLYLWGSPLLGEIFAYVTVF